ncbi:MAG: hypothetical protein K0Q72_5232, partial [Armatimonadetes bacterium]|nr:hypothetical protein [Armatimonadota bacterium]
RLGNAVLSNTDLRNADLRGADLVGRGATQRLWDTDLGGAHFRGALYDSGTHWPRGFDYTARGCVRGPEDSGSLPIPAEADAPDFDVLPRPSGGA